MLFKGTSQSDTQCFCLHSIGDRKSRSPLDGKGLGHGVLRQAGASPNKPTPPTGKLSLLMGRRPCRPLSFCLCIWVCPSPHLISLLLAFVCASGHHTGLSGRFPPSGVPRWAQVPEGVVYATITLGTACPGAGMPGVPACCLALRGHALFLSSCMGPA